MIFFKSFTIILAFLALVIKNLPLESCILFEKFVLTLLAIIFFVFVGVAQYFQAVDVLAVEYLERRNKIEDVLRIVLKLGDRIFLKIQAN